MRIKFDQMLGGLALALCATVASAQAAKPNVVILATGGTIAGACPSWRLWPTSRVNRCSRSRRKA